jgi:tyrosyl-tRNA synthetase
VQAASAALFGRGSLTDLDAQTLADAIAELAPAVVAPDCSVVDVLVAAGLAPSKGAARRTIAEGGAYLNNAKVTDVEARVGPPDALHGRWVLVRRGRRTLGAVELVGDR